MPEKKYDFSMCQLGGFIYIISGRDFSQEIVETCERYSIEEDSWSSIASVNRGRYAASSAGMEKNQKIYLFGGRKGENNQMLDEIEVYSIREDKWSLLNLKTPTIWTPVEVCAVIPIS